MKKIGKLGLTLAMVLAMAVGTMATAFAAGVETPSAEPSTPAGHTITVDKTDKAIDKVYTAAEEGLLTETEFEYELSYINAEQVGSNTTATPAGISTTSPKTIKVTVAKDADNNTKATGSITLAQLFEGIEFSAPGVYNFQLKETSAGNPNIAYDTTVYTVKVQVTWKDVANKVLQVEEIFIYTGTVDKANDTTKVTAAKFENKPNTDVGTLKVTKKVAGNAANTNDQFEFTVKLTGVKGEYTATINGGDAANAKLNDNTYQLKHGQTLVIDNLPVGAEYTVTENKGDYDSYTVDGESASTIKSGDNSVTFTNTRNVPSITGVFMDVLPYALIVVVAAAACFFFMTRRRNREDY